MRFPPQPAVRCALAETPATPGRSASTRAPNPPPMSDRDLRATRAFLFIVAWSSLGFSADSHRGRVELQSSCAGVVPQRVKGPRGGCQRLVVADPPPLPEP